MESKKNSENISLRFAQEPIIAVMKIDVGFDISFQESFFGA